MFGCGEVYFIDPKRKSASLVGIRTIDAIDDLCCLYLRHFVLDAINGELNRAREDIDSKLLMALIVDDVSVGLAELM